LKYTPTEITYVLDMGLISPLCFVCIYLLNKEKRLGYILLAIMLTVGIFVGFMVIVQTLFQIHYDIALPAAALITKVGIIFTAGHRGFLFRSEIV